MKDRKQCTQVPYLEERKYLNTCISQNHQYIFTYYLIPMYIKHCGPSITIFSHIRKIKTTTLTSIESEPNHKYCRYVYDRAERNNSAHTFPEVYARNVHLIKNFNRCSVVAVSNMMQFSGFIV